MSEVQVKDVMVKGLKEILCSQDLPESSKFSIVHANSQTNIENEVVMSKNLSKSVKHFVELSICDDINSHLSDIGITNKETWKIDAHNLSKVLIDKSKLSSVQDNLSKILDSCIKEVSNARFKYFIDSEIDISPLLQPEHLVEVAECISPEKPLDVRLNALNILCKSHIIESVNSEGWPLLKPKLIENLCDNNIEIFVTCLKIHAKLGSSSPPLVIKECISNILHSLSYHQYNDLKKTSFQSIYFYRVVYLSRLLLETFREVTLNVARFGENKLNELTDILVKLLSIHIPGKQSRNKPFISLLEVISYLDPIGRWLSNITHFNLSRRLLFSSLSKHTSFLRVSIEEVLNWVGDPVIPSRNTSSITEGEFNVAVSKYSLFCHSLSVFTTICSFSIGRSLFPVKINKNEESLSIDDVLRKLVTSLNDTRMNEILHTKGSDIFLSFLALRIAKLLCLKDINGSSLLIILLKSQDDQETFSNLVKIKILDHISQYLHYNNPFITTDITLKRKIPFFSHCFVSSTSNMHNHHSWNMKQRRESEKQGAVCADIENSEIIPFELYLKQLMSVIKCKTSNLKDISCLLQIMTRIFKHFEKLLGICYTTKVQIVQCVADIYIKLQESFKQSGLKIESNDINTSCSCAKFLLQIATSSLGFHILKESGVIVLLLLDLLQSPITDWSDPAWLLFVSKAATANEGCTVIVRESSTLFRGQLIQFWNVIEEDCSGSELPIKDMWDHLLKLISIFSFNLRGLKALMAEPKNGSEITLTDDSDIRPSNIYLLIQHFALCATNCLDFIYHQFALTVFEIFISNINSSLYLQHKLNYQDILLQLQSDNRVDENSEVIIDECSLLRQRILEKSYLPGWRGDTKPSHVAPKSESTLSRVKSRPRGNGEFARWLSETKLGLHDHNWLKHARKLYKNTGLDDIKGSTILELLEQVVKTMSESNATIKWKNSVSEGISLEPEEELAVQIVLRYGTFHRLIQTTQQNSDNFTYLYLIVKSSLNSKENSFEGFDWFIASAFLMCSGNVEKSQTFLSLISTLPTSSLLWLNSEESPVLAQLGSVLETIIAEEMPSICQVLHTYGLSWWHLCRTWIGQCWWNVLDWPHICHWFTIAILHQFDHIIYFCVALLQVNHDRLIRMTENGTFYEIMLSPAEKFQLSDARVIIDTLHKKYHGILHSHLSSL